MLQRLRRATLLYSFFISKEISGRVARTINGETNLGGRAAGLSRRPARRGVPHPSVLRVRGLTLLFPLFFSDPQEPFNPTGNPSPCDSYQSPQNFPLTFPYFRVYLTV